MAVIKQQKIPGGTLKLKQLKNNTNLSNNQYKYVVEFPDGDRSSARFTKQAGMQEFERILNNRSRSSRGAMGAMNAMEKSTESIFTGGGRF